MSAVKLDDARRVISAAEKKASEIGQPMNIAVTDEDAQEFFDYCLQCCFSSQSF